MSLSDRIRPNCEAAPWVVEEVKKLERENAALRADIYAHEQINRQLIEDKRRLDWLARNRSVSSSERPIGVTPESLRASIDAARKEAQP